MNIITQSTQYIERFVFANIAKNKTTWIRRIFEIGFYNFTLVDYLLNLFKRDSSAIASFLTVPGNLKLTFIEFLSDSLKHFHNFKYNLLYKRGNVNVLMADGR